LQTEESFCNWKVQLPTLSDLSVKWDYEVEYSERLWYVADHKVTVELLMVGCESYLMSLLTNEEMPLAENVELRKTYHPIPLASMD